MTIIARYPTELKDHIYRKGEKADWDGPITPRIAANFTDAEGNDLDAAVLAERSSAITTEAAHSDTSQDGDAAIRRAVEVLGREGIKRQLDALGVTYSPTANTNFLAKTLLLNKGEVID